MLQESSNQYTVFTVCNIAYLPKAVVLADSLVKYNGMKLRVVLFDRKQEFCYPNESVELIWVEDLGAPKWLELAFMYDIIEFSTSVKAFVALKLIESYEKVIFLDPDTCLYSNLGPILSDLDKYPILLTPHYTSPQPSAAHESDLGMMRFGSFNLGFFAVNDSSESKRFLEWWSARCIDYSFMESQFGLSTDQKWVAIAPCLFPGIHISFNLGYNAAPWNTFERVLSKDCKGRYVVNDEFPLIFYHFSNFNESDKQYLNVRASNEVGVDYPVLRELAEDYSHELAIKSNVVEKVPYSFDFMSDGSYISPTLRRAYASVRKELPSNHDPFDSAGPVGAFARKNFLICRHKASYDYGKNAFKRVTSYKRELIIARFFLKVLLRLVGPNRFFDFTKFLVYLSSLRLNRYLWKV